MRDFWKIITRFAGPYKGNFTSAILVNISSAILNIFSFTLIIPILQILFRISNTTYQFIPWNSSDKGFLDIAINNGYYFVTQFMESHGSTLTLVLLCAFMIIMTFLKVLSNFGSTAIMIPISTHIISDIRLLMYKKILSLPIGFFSKEKKGDIVAKISGDVVAVENSITSSISLLIKNPVLILAYLITMFYTSWQLTLFTIVFVPPMTWLIGLLGKQLRRGSIEVQEHWSETLSQVEETLSGLRVIKAFNAENQRDRDFEKVTELLRKKTNKLYTRQELAHPISEFLGTVIIIVVLLFGGYLILNNKSLIEAPALMFFMIMLYSIINPIKELAKAAYSIPRGLASMDRINSILNAENKIKEIEHPKRIYDFKYRIEFKDVNFNYENSEKQILSNIDLEIEKGRTIAIVGASGSGKSTLVDLIPRFYDTVSGSIFIDGIDIKNLKLSDLRDLMGNVNQEPILFHDTIFNNIAFGIDNATEEQVIEAAKIANAHEFIIEKEDGYDTIIGDRGIKLSGGQRQRLSIARAILKNPPILILDEATASLDTESERIVQEALDRLMSSRTTIAIAHRLSTIKNADEIIVLNEGKIVERGKHEELILLNGYYRKLHDMQAL